MCVHGRVFVQSRQLNVPVSRHREEIETNMFFTALETGVTFNRSCPAVSPNTRHFGALIVFFFFIHSSSLLGISKRAYKCRFDVSFQLVLGDYVLRPRCPFLVYWEKIFITRKKTIEEKKKPLSPPV